MSFPVKLRVRVLASTITSLHIHVVDQTSVERAKESYTNKQRRQLNQNEGSQTVCRVSVCVSYVCSQLILHTMPLQSVGWQKLATACLGFVNVSIGSTRRYSFKRSSYYCTAAATRTRQNQYKHTHQPTLELIISLTYSHSANWKRGRKYTYIYSSISVVLVNHNYYQTHFK